MRTTCDPLITDIDYARHGHTSAQPVPSDQLVVGTIRLLLTAVLCGPTVAGLLVVLGLLYSR